MFHRDPEWLGGDDAYSVDLGDGRVAWFFGDSFVAPTTPGERRGTTMVRNSVGLQTGYDPDPSQHSKPIGEKLMASRSHSLLMRARIISGRAVLSSSMVNC